MIACLVVTYEALPGSQLKIFDWGGHSEKLRALQQGRAQGFFEKMSRRVAAHGLKNAMRDSADMWKLPATACSDRVEPMKITDDPEFM